MTHPLGVFVSCLLVDLHTDSLHLLSNRLDVVGQFADCLSHFGLGFVLFACLVELLDRIRIGLVEHSIEVFLQFLLNFPAESINWILCILP